MHLSYSASQYKGQTYKSYTIAESYRDGKKVRKRTIWPIGKLSDLQAEQIKLILKVVQGGQIVTRLIDIVVKDTRAYLDIAVVNDLWNQWEMDSAFNYDVTDSPLPTHTVAKILTINRCTDPCSHYSVPQWAKKIALEGVQILGGYGYTMEYDAQRYLRDVLILSIGGGTTQIQKNIVGRTLGL